MTTLHRLSLAAALAGAALAPAAAATLYDATAGTLPTAQGWATLAIGAPAAQSVAGGLYRLDTTGAGVSYFGNAMVSSQALDTAAGFQLSFSLQLQSETHSSANRAGYSLVVVGADPTKAVELDFWTSDIWVPDYVASDPDRFVHGNDVAIDTTAALRRYTLTVVNQQYTLASAGSTLLTGSMHDYSAGGPPYTTANFLFFGDDSSRGTSVSQLGYIALTAVPEPAAASLLAAGLLLLAWRRRASAA
jgi:hypothetical protein